jgi:parallel beta-helix repeat protein
MQTEYNHDADMRKTALAVALAGILFSALACTVHFGTVQAATKVVGVINSDATWTHGGSPYNLTGPVTVNNGVTLAIRAGVIVNLNEYTIQVDGILDARGFVANGIIFNSDPYLGGGIIFQSDSTSWNEQTGTGCIIENAVLDSTSISISGASPMINKNYVTDAIYVNDGGSPSILNNTITNATLYVEDGSPLISENNITGRSTIQVSKGSPIISNNTITGGSQDAYRRYDVISIDSGVSSALISNNTIVANSPEYDGIYFGENNVASVSGNVISGCKAGISLGSSEATIENNLLIDNYVGVKIRSCSNLLIRYNNVTNNTIGIDLKDCTSPTILHNNIYNNSQNSIYLSSSPHWSTDIDATYNWWGTTNTQAINQTIYDFKNDFNLANVSFIPFLADPYSESSPLPPEPTPTPTELNAVEIAILVVLVVIAALLVVNIGLLLRKRR